MFCNDICHQIDWLENIYTTFHYRPMGIVFCCSVDEVIASQRLDGFDIPQEYIPTTTVPTFNLSWFLPNTTTVESVDTTVYEETTEREQEYDDDDANLY